MENRSKYSFWQLQQYLRPLLFVAVVLTISLFFPTNLKFKYKYEPQKTWQYEDLAAPFDFPIKKTNEEIKIERAELLAQTTPVYQVDPKIAEERKAAFVLACQEQLNQTGIEEYFQDVPSNPNLYINHGLSFLDQIFGKGIIRLAETHQEFTKSQLITIIRSNTAEELTIENVLTLQEANKLLVDSLPYSELKEPEFLLPLIQQQLQANLFYNPERTQLFIDNAGKELISPYHGLVKQGQFIVAKNAIITNDIYQILISFEDAYKEQVSSNISYWNVYLGYLLLTILIVVLFYLFLKRFAPFIYSRNHKLIFVLMWLVIYSYLVYIIQNYSPVSPYIIPFCIVPIVIKIFFNEKLAILTHLVVILIASFLCSLGYEFIFIQVLAGFVVILGDFDTRKSGRFFTSLLFIFLTYAVTYLGLSLVKESSLEHLDWSIYTLLFINVFLTLLAYPLIPLLERLFGFVSAITLVELSDMNQPLLRELAIKAPGTLQHSLQVGNLAETAARKIGANPLLVRVAALYHDIGKCKHPEYYIENLGGNQSPHLKKTAKESASIIISHVAEGAEMAKKAGLPSILINFILSHHGTTRTEYFYRSYINENPKRKEIDDALFQYSGPKPQSKEECILMLADSVEAACKSLQNPNQQELFDFIDKIFDSKLNSGQLQQSLLSFQDLENCRSVFKKIMKSVYHIRVAYPGEEE